MLGPIRFTNASVRDILNFIGASTGVNIMYDRDFNDRSYTIRFDGARWSRQRGDASADVSVQTSPAEWVTFLSADVEGRRRWLRKRRATGTRQRLDELATAFGVAQAPLRSTRS